MNPAGMSNPTTVEAAYRPFRLAQDFPAEELGGQFILTKKRDWIPRGWNVFSHGSWWLGVHPGLPVTTITAPDGQITCFLLGHMVTESARVLEQGAASHWPAGNGMSDFEEWLYRHGGRFAAIYLGRDAERIYLDGFGSLAVVYSSIAHTVASTNMLIPYVEGTEDNDPLIDDVGIPHQNKYFPFGLSPRRNIGRLLPNHYLDLKSWETIRHWPIRDFEPTRNTRESVAEIGEILGKTVMAFVEHCGGVNLSVTAGGDSRMLLAASRASREHIHTFTFDLKPAVSAPDVAAGARIARRGGVPHNTYVAAEATEMELRRWIWRNGASAHAIIGWRNQHAFLALDTRYPYMPALAGELGRPVFYLPREDSEKLPDVQWLRHFWGIPANDSVTKWSQAWFDGLPAVNRMTALGLCYIENRVGCWAGPVLYSQWGTGAFPVFPFSHRRIIELIMSLPAEYRMEEHFVIDLVRMHWPGLLSIPFFRYPTRRAYAAWWLKLGLSGFGLWQCPLEAKTLHPAKPK